MTDRHDLAHALRQRLLSGASLGHLHSGDRLPSIRQLAVEFGVGLRSVLAAYRELEREGLVELRERSGIFFGMRGASTKHENDADRSHPDEWVLDVFHQGYVRGSSVPDVVEELARYLTRTRIRVAGIECNDDQITGLTEALIADFGLDAVGLNVDDLLGSPSPSLDGIDLLITTAFHAGEVQELAARARTSWLAISYRSDVFAEIANVLSAAPVYYLVTDPRFVAKLRKIYASLPGSEKLQIINLHDVDSIAIPQDVATYASSAARNQLKGDPILDRIVPATRLITNDSARELLSFILR